MKYGIYDCCANRYNFFHIQSSKVLAKKELAYVPVIGWMWYFLEIVFCKRKWEDDQKTVVQSLQRLKDYPENFWVKVFLIIICFDVSHLIQAKKVEYTLHTSLAKIPEVIHFNF